jgi:hypothetical protein
MLTLQQARQLGKIKEFAEQEERRGVKAVLESDYGRALEALIKAPQSEDQTSRSLSRGGSSGK